MENLPTLVTVLGSAIALVVGAWLKTKPEFSNKLIPWVTIIISVLTQIVQAIPPAMADDGLAHPGVNWVGVLVAGVLAGFTTIGVFSWFKNAVVGKVSGSTKVLS